MGLRGRAVQQIDAEWIDVAAASMDAVLCRWGFMQMADPAPRCASAGGCCARRPAGARRLGRAGGQPLVVGRRRGAASSAGTCSPRRPAARGSSPGRRRATIEALLEEAGFVDEIEVEAVRFAYRESFADWWERTLAMSRSGKVIAGLPAASAKRSGPSWRGGSRARRASDGAPGAVPRADGPRPQWRRPRRPWLQGMFYDDDADLGLLDAKTVAILGYGSQGHAHALNLKDSGIDVVVGLREGSSSVAKAEGDGLEVLSVAEAAGRGDIVMVLLPDEKHRQVWEGEVADGIATGNLLLFGHGFSIHYGEIEPPPDVDVALVAPKGPGHLVRRQYIEGSGVPGLVAVHQDATRPVLDLALAYAQGIGCTRGGVIRTTFKDETETDLFGEQAVLCGGASELVRAGFDTLVEAGYDPRMAYFECLHELKLIVDLMYEKGISGMRHSISNTAEYGDLTRGTRIVTDETRKAMKQILAEIQSGEFAREWIAENRAGQENFQRMRQEGKDHQVEKTGADLRDMMDWIKTEF